MFSSCTLIRKLLWPEEDQDDDVFLAAVLVGNPGRRYNNVHLSDTAYTRPHVSSFTRMRTHAVPVENALHQKVGAGVTYIVYGIILYFVNGLCEMSLIHLVLQRFQNFFDNSTLGNRFAYE